MTHIHHDVLDPNQASLVPLVSEFAHSFYVARGTALALQYGHRRSIDFDLFCEKPFDNQKIRNTVRGVFRIEQIFEQEFDEKLFREQLAFHQDINYSDTVIFMPGFDVPNDQMLQFLIQMSVS